MDTRRISEKEWPAFPPEFSKFSIFCSNGITGFIVIYVWRKIHVQSETNEAGIPLVVEVRIGAKSEISKFKRATLAAHGKTTPVDGVAPNVLHCRIWRDIRDEAQVQW